jgi:hypothetical protein
MDGWEEETYCAWHQAGRADRAQPPARDPCTSAPNGGQRGQHDRGFLAAEGGRERLTAPGSGDRGRDERSGGSRVVHAAAGRRLTAWPTLDSESA